MPNKEEEVDQVVARSLPPSNKHVCGALTMITRASERARPYLIGSAQTSKALCCSLSPSLPLIHGDEARGQRVVVVTRLHVATFVLQAQPQLSPSPSLPSLSQPQ